MKVAVLIMSSGVEPSLRNENAMKETFIKDAVDLMSKNMLNNTYDFYFYSYTNSIPENSQCCCENIAQHIKYLHFYGKESIYNTFEKTISALQYIQDDYQWYVRINISAFLNMRLLDVMIKIFNLYPNKVYCNAINSYITDEYYYNDLYPRGDMIIFSKKTKNDILSVSSKYIRCDIDDKNRINIPHVDDCLIGLCLIDIFGKKYYEHLQMVRYNFLPEITLQESQINKFAICSRVKTTPPGEYSGYSWEDNDFRKSDVNKMYLLQQYFSSLTYNDISIQSLINNVININNLQRQTLCVMLNQATIPQLIQYIKEKRG